MREARESVVLGSRRSLASGKGVSFVRATEKGARKEPALGGDRGDREVPPFSLAYHLIVMMPVMVFLVGILLVMLY